MRRAPARRDPSGRPRRLTYRAPEAMEIDRTAHLVQVGGGGSGLDWYHFYYFDSNGR